jgi:hypothetical protein
MSVTALFLPFVVAAIVAGPVQETGVEQNGTSPRRDESAPRNGTQSPPAPALSPDDLPVSVEKIQRALSREPAIRIMEVRSDSGLPVFRVRIEGDKITIEDILGPDFLRGPAPAGAMTHQEFLDMVTPKDVQGYAAFTNKQGLVVAATSFALQWAVQTALRKFQEAKNEREKEAARKEVREALEALRRARLEAGLPDK